MFWRVVKKSFIGYCAPWNFYGIQIPVDYRLGSTIHFGYFPEGQSRLPGLYQVHSPECRVYSEVAAPMGVVRRLYLKVPCAGNGPSVGEPRF